MDYFKLKINDTLLYSNKTYTIVEAADYTDYDIKWKEYLVESDSDNFWISFLQDGISSLKIYEYNEIDYSGYSESNEIEYEGEKYSLLTKGRVMATVTFENNDTDNYKVGYFNYADYLSKKFFSVRKVESDYKYYTGKLIPEWEITVRQSAASNNVYKGINNYGNYQNSNYNYQNTPQTYQYTTTTTEIYSDDDDYYRPSTPFTWIKVVLIAVIVLALIFAMSTCTRVATYYDSRPVYGRTYYNDNYYHRNNHYYYGGTSSGTRVRNTITTTTVNTGYNQNYKGSYSNGGESFSKSRRSSFKSFG